LRVGILTRKSFKSDQLLRSPPLTLIFKVLSLFIRQRRIDVRYIKKSQDPKRILQQVQDKLPTTHVGGDSSQILAFKRLPAGIGGGLRFRVSL